MFESKLGLGFLVIVSLCVTAESKCSRGCELALGSYYVSENLTLGYIANVMNGSVAEIGSYNQLSNTDSIQWGTRLNVPFSCDCINGEFFGHVFLYDLLSGDTYDKVATTNYANLTTAAWLERFNEYPPSRIPDTGQLNVTVNCSCGDGSVSKEYGLFITYPLRPGETLESIAGEANITTDLLQRYNPSADFGAGTGLVYIPGKNKSGNYPPLKSSTRGGLSGAIIAGISIAGVAGVLLLAVCVFVGLYRKKKVEDNVLLSETYETRPLQATRAPVGCLNNGSTGNFNSYTPLRKNV